MTSEMQQLGKYKIVEEVGYGGYATVYRAADRTLDREVALKVLKPQLLADNIFVQRFEQEARTLAQLRHPNIVTVFEVGQAEGRLFIAMEFARGGSLADLIAARKQISWSETLLLLDPVCKALDHAHEQDVVHRDLKPSNILLDDGAPMISDFGFARILGRSSVSLSMSGGIVGTPGYIAPEVWEYNKATPATDIYALGCVVYELLTGDVLFTGETPMQIMRAHDRGPQFPEQWPDDVPAGIDAVLQKALDPEPAERHSDAQSFLYALKDAEEQVATEEVEALVARWRSEVETAIDAGEWRVARMAIGRWQALAPDDPVLERARAKLDRLTLGDRKDSDTTSASSAHPTAPQESASKAKVPETSDGAGKKRNTAPKSVRTSSKPKTTYSRRQYARPTEESFSAKSNLQIWMQWVIANVIGVAAGTLVILRMAETVPADGVFAGVLFTVIIFGPALGIPQWYVVRHGRVDGQRWVVATGGGVVLSLIGILVLSESFQWDLNLATGGAVGIMFALPQWYILRRYVVQAGWWLVANGVGVGLGTAAIVNIDANDPSEFVLLAALFGGITAAVTGAVLVWLLDQSESTRMARS